MRASVSEERRETLLTSCSPSPARQNEWCWSPAGWLWVLPWDRKMWMEMGPADPVQVELRSLTLNSQGK